MENNMLLIIIITIVVIMLITSNKKEGFSKFNRNSHESYIPRSYNSRSYNPRSFYPAISNQAIDDNFIPMPQESDYPWADNTGNYGESDIVDDGNKGNMSLHHNLCSKACCSQQWPVSHQVLTSPDDFVLLSGKDYVPSNYTCNNGWQDSGCLCLTKEQALFMNRRGGNAYQNV
jgi:hypothetical protein